MTTQVQADEMVDVARIFAIESSWNDLAHNKTTDARGLGQITPIALKEWNQCHPLKHYTPDDLFDADINEQVSSWLMNVRAPSLLRFYHTPDTIDNRIIAYKAGIRNAIHGNITPSTRKYLNKYHQGELNGHRK